MSDAEINIDRKLEIGEKMAIPSNPDDPDIEDPAEYEEEDVVDIDPEEEIVEISYDITSYGADYPVDGLVKRINNDDIVVPTFHPTFETEDIQGFQREFVWSRPQMDRFIESLLLGLPVPGIFLVRQPSNRFLVLDGQQRLRTLQAYYNGIHKGKEYSLRGVQGDFEGRSYQQLEDNDRRRLDDSIIHATILRQETPESGAGSNSEAVYTIFERLNTGGSPLQAQEIRIALYSGSFLMGIAELNDNSSWRILYGNRSKRYKDHELILRVLALFEDHAAYRRPVKGFLNDYIERNQDRQLVGSALANNFLAAAQFLADVVGRAAFRPVRSLNAAVLDSVMVGLMRRVGQGSPLDATELGAAYQDLVVNPDYQAATTSSTAAEETVAARISLATDAFEAL